MLRLEMPDHVAIDVSEKHSCFLQYLENVASNLKIQFYVWLSGAIFLIGFRLQTLMSENNIAI